MRKQFTPEERRAWADKLGINERYLYQCLTGRRDMGPTEARRVETESGGVLTRQMLCQKTWGGIWPELTPLDPAQNPLVAPATNSIGLDITHSDQERREKEDRRVERQRRKAERRALAAIKQPRKSRTAQGVA